MATLAYRDILRKQTQNANQHSKTVSSFSLYHRRPLVMYLTVLDNSMGSVLGQHDESGRKEHVIYYLSKKFTDCETRYSLLEKTCCTLVWAACRLRQYMLTHTTLLISKMDPIMYIFEKPSLSGRIARWQMILTEYDI